MFGNFTKRTMQNNDDGDTLLREIYRELNGLRQKKIQSKQSLNMELKKVERCSKKPKKSIETKYEIEEYAAYDPISHHILVNFKGNYPTIPEKYEWQPVISLLLLYYENCALDLVKELEDAIGFHAQEYFRNTEEYISSKDTLWFLERKPIIDFGHKFNEKEPFIGYVPENLNGVCMIIFSLKKKDGRNIYCLTDSTRLKEALKIRKQLKLLDNMERFISTKELEINEVWSKRTKEEIFDSLFHIMGGHIPLSELKEEKSCVNLDLLWNYVEGTLGSFHRVENVSESEYAKKGPWKARLAIQK